MTVDLHTEFEMQRNDVTAKTINICANKFGLIRIIIKLPFDIISYCTSSSDSGYSIWISTLSEDEERSLLFLVTQSQLVNKESEIWKSTICYPNKGQQASDIFTDLLDSDSEDVVPLSRLTPSLVRVSRDNALLHTTCKILAICAFSELVVSAFYSRLGFLIHIYIIDDATVSKKSELKICKEFYIPYHKEWKTGVTTCKLFCLWSESMITQQKDNNAGSCISVKLFNNLFGNDASLAQTLVILVCTSDGTIFSIRTKEISHQSSQNSLNTFHIFYMLSNQVIGIHGCVYSGNGDGKEKSAWYAQSVQPSKTEHRSSDVSTCNALLLIAVNGQCVAVTIDKERIEYVSFTIPAPVRCTCVNVDKLYHSNRKDVFKTDVFSEPETPRQSKELELGNIDKLAFVKQDADSCSLLCFNESGRKYVLSPEDSLKHTEPVLSSKAATQRLRDLSLCIERISDRRTHLNSLKESQNQILSQLALAASMLTQNSKAFMEKKSISNLLDTAVCVKHSELSGETMHFCCEIINRSGVCFSSQWKFLMMLSHFNNRQDSLTNSVHINSKELRPNTSVMMHMSIDPYLITSPEVTVAICAIYDCQDLNNILEARSKSVSGIIIKLLTKTFNSLDFMQPTKIPQEVKEFRKVALSDRIKNIAKGKPFYNVIAKPKQSDGVSTDFSLKLFLSKDTLQKYMAREGLACLVLSTLLQAAESPAPMMEALCCSGHTMMMKMQADGQIWTLEMRTKDQPSVLAALRLGVTQELQKYRKNDTIGKSKQELIAIMTNIKKVQMELRHILEENTTRQTPPNVKQLWKIYELLRQAASFPW